MNPIDPVTSNLISASAGTGKTYKLASRFIALLALGYPVEKLIALTFTRNAAGEFKGRILSALAKGAASAEGAEELSRRIRETLGSTQKGNVPLCPQVSDTLPLGQDKYRSLLREVVDKLSRLNLATMDSFFTKLVSMHRYELGFPSLHQMDEAEVEKVRQDALKSMLYEAERSDENTDALMELCQDISGNSKRDVFSVLNENVREYYALYLDTLEDDEIWGALAAFGLTDAHTMSEIRKMSAWKSAEVDRYMQDMLRDYNELVPALMERIRSQGVKLGKYVVSGCENLAEKLQKGDSEISPSLCEWLYSAPGECEDEEKLRYIVKHTRDVATLLPLVRKTLGMRNLMKCYDEKYKEEVRASGKLVFDDMPRLVADKLLDVSNEEGIAYRLDGQLDHWMLDEFQDTSPGQWAAIKPLLETIQSDVYQNNKQSQRSIFVVGDEKQSIYGWRGATPELFSYLKNGGVWSKIFGITLQNESFRSADAIMGEARYEGGHRLGFVNDLFSCIFCQDAAKKAEFSRHRVSDAMLGKPGYVRVERVCDGGKPDGIKAREKMCERMAETLDEIKYEQKNLSVAILVRSNSDVRAICRWFRDHRSDFPVIPLADETVGEASLLGQMFLHFFKWLLHPGDVYRENLLCHSSLRVMEGQSPAAAWVEWRRTLENSGIVRVLELLTDGIPCAQNDRIYREWLNEARSFETGGGALEEWIRHIENHTTKSNPPKSCIHVMTFHKSKGTEYDVVFLPFSSIRAVNERVKVVKVVEHESDEAHLHGVLVCPKPADWLKSKNMKMPSNSPYNAVARRWKAEQMEEALNVLYVAVTRAKYANYLFINGYRGRGQTVHAYSYSDIISRAMAEFDRSISPEPALSEDAPILGEWGDSLWYEASAFSETESPLAPESPALQLPAAHARRRKLTPSKMEKSEHESYAGHTAVDGSDAAAFGTAVHALFEQVEWLGQGEEPEWLAGPRSVEEKLVSAALLQEDIRALYTRQPGQVAYNEQSIDAISLHRGDEVWISGTLDRLVLTHDAAGRVAEAHIIDFKTDIRRGESADEQDAHLCETHRAQMRAYHELIMRAFDLPAEAVRITLISCPRDGVPARAVPVPL